MKIAMMTDAYYPQPNGVAVSVYLYKKYLEKLGHEVYVVTPFGAKTDEKVLIIGGKSFPWEKNHFVPSSGRLLPIINFLKQNKIEVIHSHAPFALGFRALAVQKYLGLPHVHTYHTLLVEYRHYIPKPLRPSAKSVEEFSSWFCNMVNRVVAPTEKIKSELISYGVKRPIDVVPTGIDVEHFQKPCSSDIRKKFNIDKTCKLLLYVGRLAHEKNVLFLLDVLKKLREKHLNVHLLFVGDGPAREEILDYAIEINVDDFITLAGAVNRDELPDYYQQADLFVFASTTETQGLVVLEALAAGTPVVAVKKMGIANVLKEHEGALLVDEPNVHVFAEKVEQILSNHSLYENMRQRGKEYVASNWSMEKRVKELLETYQKALEEGPIQVEFWNNLWVEVMLEKMKEIYNKIFQDKGGAKGDGVSLSAGSHRR
ncbi:glycosyltransferase family 4 protein [Pseudothermotoga thermarum]|uniref:Glycosyl transferase group 1 n=1 Tax=Pseudothermotoga thermarum DSM 5069 TaxID=688269 RepID=F7YYE7_9THEM|nr:glycosyltransferase family 4 protein [Pseudothermotoga thermarum]AEH50971.1 glycosyl transferase group 1 [Pseudothermotoga thermarum DSM 5069]